MSEQIKANPVGAFSRGFLGPFRAVRFILDHRQLLKYILIPFAINLVVFSTAVYLGFDFFAKYVMHRIPQGEAWYWFLLDYFVWTIAILLTAVLVFFSFTIIGNLTASPFNDLLSEKTEGILTGHFGAEPFSFRIFFQDAGRTLLDEAKKMLLFVCGMSLLLLLNLLPVVGSLAYSVLSVLFTVFFLTVEYTGYVFSRKHLPFKEQRRFIFSHTFLLFGFGLGVLCGLAIPFFQFLCIPLGVVGATMLCHDTAWPPLRETGN